MAATVVLLSLIHRSDVMVPGPSRPPEGMNDEVLPEHCDELRAMPTPVALDGHVRLWLFLAVGVRSSSELKCIVYHVYQQTCNFVGLRDRAGFLGEPLWVVQVLG